MRVGILAFALVIAVFASTSSARAGCWPSDSLPLVCSLDTHGLACSEHHALTSARAVQYPHPRYSFYEFETVHWWTADPTVACPPTKTIKFSSSWDRETGKAEETASTGFSTWTRYIYCGHNPWTGQGPATPSACVIPAGDPNADFPATVGMLSASQRSDLLRVQEPLHTRCLQVSPSEFGSTWLTGSAIVKVVVSHHEFQKIEWHLWFLDFYDYGPWHEVAAPKTKVPLLSPATTYSDGRVATSARSFWLNKPGRWKIVAVPKPTWWAAQLVATSVTNECPGAEFDVQ